MTKCIAGFIAFLMVFLSLATDAQKLRAERFDGTARKWQLETFPVNLKSAADTKTNITFSTSDTTVTLYLSGTGVGTSTVDLGSELVFQLNNDSTVVARSTSIQGINFDNLVSSYRHQYEMSTAALQTLSRHPVKALRKFSAGGVDIIPIEKKNVWKVSELSSLLVSKMKEKKMLPENMAIVAPGFPGGKEVFSRFLNRNLKQLPDLQRGEKKSTVVALQIGADGIIRDIQLRSSISTALDDELVRILQRMPKWKPALQNGKPVPFAINQPISLIRVGDTLRVEL